MSSTLVANTLEYGSTEELHDRIRAIVKRSLDGEGVIHWTPGNFCQLIPDSLVHLNFGGNPYTKTAGYTAVAHTHDSGFTSRVVYGSIIHIPLDVARVPDSPWEKFEIRDLGNGNKTYYEFHATGEYYEVLRSQPVVFEPGVIYQMDPRDWHVSIFPEPVITLLDMWQHKPIPYYTLAPKGMAYPPADRRIKPEDMPAIRDYLDTFMRLAGLL
jgi:hypothetical protein